MYHSLLCCMCWHRSLLSLLFDRERKFLHKHAHLWSTSSPESKICIFIFLPLLMCYKLWWYYIFECASGFKTLRTAQMAATPLCTAEVSAVCLHRWMEEGGFSRLIALRYESDCAKKQKMANQCLPVFLLNLQPHYRLNLTQISFRSTPLIASSAVVPDNSLSSEPFSQHPCVLKSHAMTHNASRWRNTVTVEASEVSSQISPQNFHLNQFAWEMTLHVCSSSSIMKTTPPKLQNSNI